MARFRLEVMRTANRVDWEPEFGRIKGPEDYWLGEALREEGAQLTPRFLMGSPPGAVGGWQGLRAGLQCPQASSMGGFLSVFIFLTLFSLRCSPYCFGSQLLGI